MDKWQHASLTNEVIARPQRKSCRIHLSNEGRWIVRGELHCHIDVGAQARNSIRDDRLGSKHVPPSPPRQNRRCRAEEINDNRLDGHDEGVRRLECGFEDPADDRRRRANPGSAAWPGVSIPPRCESPLWAPTSRSGSASTRPFGRERRPNLAPETRGCRG
jgi:hypothetical protein